MPVNLAFLQHSPRLRHHGDTGQRGTTVQTRSQFQPEPGGLQGHSNNAAACLYIARRYSSSLIWTTPPFDVRTSGLFCGWPGGLELVTRLPSRSDAFCWQFWKLFFSYSTSIHSALGASRLCAIQIYYWHSTLTLTLTLKRRLIATWSGLRQHVIDEAIDLWCGRLYACVTADGWHSGHLLWYCFSRLIVHVASSWVPASAGKAKAGVVHSVNGWTRSVQVKLWDPLRTRAMPERLRGVFTTRRYTNPRLPYLTFTVVWCACWTFLAETSCLTLYRNVTNAIVSFARYSSNI